MSDLRKNFAPKKGAPAPEQKGPVDVRRFPVWQSRLARQLGVPIEMVRSRRDELLEEGVDWILHGRVLLTATAAERLRASFCAARSEEKPQGGAVARATATSVAATLEHMKLLDVLRQRSAQLPPVLVVVRSAPHIKNRRIVEVASATGDGPDGEGPVRLMWVRDNRFFKVGHRIEPEHYERNDSADGEQLMFTGRRPPRS